MTEFRTPVNIKPSSFKIGYQTPLLFVGSCFTESIGKKMQWYKFPVDINPFGVVYNPVSVANTLYFISNRTHFSKVDLHYNNEQWFSFYHHSSFSDTDANRCLENINSRIDSAFDFLKKSKAVFISLGTAWVYEHKKEKIIVSNNHKLPANKFNRHLLSVNEIVNRLSRVIQYIRDINPEQQIIFTVSPVRHWKDGPVNNQLSKSSLIVAVHEIINKYEGTGYFPSYEIMMDDLRNYRFYDTDMIHLSETAVDYIWQKFKTTYIDASLEKVMRKIEKINKAKEHTPFRTDTKEYLDFLTTTLNKIMDLQKKYPYIDLEEEITIFERKVSSVRNTK